MSNPKILLLLKNLRSATSKGRLTWSETLKDHFAVKLNSVTIIVAKDSEGGTPMFHVSLLDSRDRFAERESFQRGDEGYDLALAIHDQVLGKAPGGDHLIDNVIADLDFLMKK